MSNAFDRQVDGDWYRKLPIQPAEYIHKNKIGFIEGSVIKYMTRWRDKGGVQDLEKAKHFIELLIEMERKSDEEVKEGRSFYRATQTIVSGELVYDSGPLQNVKKEEAIINT